MAVRYQTIDTINFIRLHVNSGVVEPTKLFERHLEG